MTSAKEARLVVAGGPDGGARYPLRLGDQVIGPGGDVDVPIGSDGVGPRHAHVYWDGANATVTDTGCGNGTLVNGSRVAGAQPLRSGDVIRVGDVELRYEDPIAPADVRGGEHGRAVPARG